MTQSSGRLGGMMIALAVIGSVLMFAGWVLAIVPAFHAIHRVILVVGVAVVGFGLVLVPAGLDLFFVSGDTAGKRSSSSLPVSYLPAIILFLITVISLPLPLPSRVMAVIVEALGMIAYGWAWWAHTHSAAFGSRAAHRRSA